MKLKTRVMRPMDLSLMMDLKNVGKMRMEDLKNGEMGLVKEEEKVKMDL